MVSGFPAQNEGIPNWRWRWYCWCSSIGSQHPELVLGMAHVTPRYYKTRTFNSQAATATGRTIDWKFCAEDAVALLEKDYAFDAWSTCGKFSVPALFLDEAGLVGDYHYAFLHVIC